MDNLIIANALERNAGVFKSMLQHLSPELVNWKPNPEKWNLLEVVCHLTDEEDEDFRYRLKHTLETPDQPMPPIDPQGWVVQRQYAEQNFDMKLIEFLDERKDSIHWLRSLMDVDWNSTYEHPQLGPMTAGLFLHNWLAHDYLHIRQICRIKFEYLATHAKVPLGYAGTW